MTSARIRTIYDLVCRSLLEINGPKLGLITEDDILKEIQQVIFDFLQQGAMIRSMDIIPTLASVPQYTEADTIVNTEEVYVDEEGIYDESTFDIAQNDYGFELAQLGRPTRFRFDQQMPKKFSLQPKPSWTGPQSEVIGGDILLGTVAETQPGVSVDVVVDAPFFGTISGDYESEVYLETDGPMLGVIADIVTSDRNITLFGVSQPAIPFGGLDDFVEQIPRSFTYYIRFGVLARIFTNNSELKDLSRAKYCRERYQEGCRLAAAVNTSMVYTMTMRTT